MKPGIITAAAIAMTVTTSHAQPPSAEDRFAMIDAVTSIAAGADRHDWSRVRNAFADEVVLDYTSLWGGEAAAQSADDIVAQWSGFLPGFDETLHLVTNHTVVSFDDGAAIMEADFQAMHRIGDDQWVLSGHYTYGLQKSDGDWKVSALTMTWTHEAGSRDLVAAAAERASQ